MKFNLNDFLQLDTNGLLAVNGGSDCSSGSPSGSSDSSSGSSIASGGTGGNSGSSGGSSNAVPIKYGSRGKGWWGPVAWSDGSYLDGNGNRVYPSSTKTRTASGGASSGGGGCGNAGSSVGGTSPNSAPKYPSGQGGSSDPSGGNNGGGTCSAGTQTPPVENPNTEKTSGKFAQITDGSYADNLTMQFYKNIGDEKSDNAMYGTHIDKNSNKEIDNKFSTVGCKAAATTKIISELKNGTYVDMTAVQYFCDENQDGNLTAAEISSGLDKMLDSAFGDIFDVTTQDFTSNITINTLNDISNQNNDEVSYVLGWSPDCHGGHWVVLEGYNTNSNGIVSFDYDGSSDNDKGRSFVLGKNAQDASKEIWGITRIQTFKIYQK